MTDGCFPAHDGLDLCWQAWLPAGAAKAVVAVVHGIFEHGGRYGDFGQFLAAHGYAAYVYDHRGHGRSQGPRAMIWSIDHLVSDLDRFLAFLRSRHAGLPLFVFGHSMGGQVTALWAIRAEAGSVDASDVRGIVLSAPAVIVGNKVFPLLRRLASLFSRLTPRLRLVRMGSRYLSRDPEVVRRFREDPLVFHARFPVRTGAEALAAAERIEQNMESIHLPLLILHGTGDEVADAEGSRLLHRRAGTTDKTLKLYDGLYHEVLSEPERGQVMQDILEWLEQRR
ncbi:MAG: alpha/beta hydrolase [Planctomycetota bacterium]